MLDRVSTLLGGMVPDALSSGYHRSVTPVNSRGQKSVLTQPYTTAVVRRAKATVRIT